jgi:hypothetical protein
MRRFSGAFFPTPGRANIGFPQWNDHQEDTY